MRYRKKKHPSAGEAANPDTIPTRLMELAQEYKLHPIIAANPNTPPEVLENFANHSLVAVRRATAQNPNTPLKQLLLLTEEFPHEFLRNPILPLLNLTEPNFIKNASPRAWLQLLRCEEIPQHWLQWFQQGHVMNASYVREHILLSYNAHICVAGEVADVQKIQKSQHDLLQPRSPLYGNGSIHELLIRTCGVLPDFINHRLHRQVENINVEELVFSLRYSPHIDEDILRKLASHQMLKVRLAVAHHPGTPEDVLLQMLQDKELDVRYSIAKRRKMLQSLLMHLAASSDPLLRRGAARHPQLEKHMLESLSHDPDVIVRRAVASRHKLPKRLYHLLVQDTDMTVRKAIAARHGLSEEHYYQLAQDTYTPVRMVLARNVKTPSPLLLDLARDIEPVVRYAVAQNPRLPQEAFYLLANDSDNDILAQLAGNARLPRDLFMRFAEHSDVNIFRNLITNPRIPLELLNQLRMQNSNQKSASFQANFAYPSVVSPKERTQMRLDSYAKALQSMTSDSLRLELLAYEKLPIQFLYSFARSPIPLERYQSAQHPNASLALLKELAQDANRYVRAVARQQLALRDENKAETD
ncbi:hypothetical protein KSD_49250 [Ktedonobacter sp. SOSP1-85]|uniref:variant leucine-rich repeat-containing protein n=1 Tax=Ktedonobacter sp. SOSP1-85 TaxID=2778367 RepID=UPI001916056B|nr:hypothetical protein [Ktedonobacter sp. SOSP1-85]GHO77154.1 hypothetical protein KSD_49250 [Ktedonobacter sp. SOSP1-85]